MDPLWIFAAGMLVALCGILFFRLHAFLALILAAFIVAVITPSGALAQYAAKTKQPEKAQQPAIERVSREFFATAGRIGLMIALATIIGKCLLDSGGADRIVRSLLQRLGEKHAALALLISGFVLGIPVFFDTVFLLMIPLGKSLRFITGHGYRLYVLSIIAGATMTHSLVPPTPGPLFIALELKVNMGLMILGGCLVGAITAACGWAFAHWLERKPDFPLRATAQTSLEDLEQFSRRDEKDLPPFWLAILPILLPVALITGAAFIKSSLVQTLGNPNVALALSVLIGIGMLWRQGRKPFAAVSIGTLGEAASIVLITSAGGAFGGALQQSGIGARIQELSLAYHLPMIPLAWGLTALLRTAQGSATVAMVTTVGVLSGMATPEALGFHPLWLALAIGCGSKLIPWMNDSGFWVINKMSGLTEKECLTTYTPMVCLMGVVGLLVVMLLAKLFPLV